MQRHIWIFMLLLALPMTASASDFKNPDGRPGTFGFEPFFSYYNTATAKFQVGSRPETDLDDVSSDFWNLGLSVLIPTSERVTVFARFDYSRQSFEQPIFADGLQLASKTTTPAYRFGISIRYWVGETER